MTAVDEPMPVPDPPGGPPAKSAVKPLVVIGAVVVLVAMIGGFLVYSAVSGSSNVTTWLSKNYTAADDATARAATDREAAFGISFPSIVGSTTSGSTPLTSTTTTTATTATSSGTTPGTATSGTSVKLPTVLRPDAMYVSPLGVEETDAAIDEKFTPSDTQNRDGRIYLEYEEAVVGVVPALTGSGCLVFVDKGDTGYRRWGHHTGAIWGISRAGRSFSSGGGGSSSGGGGRGGGSGGGK